MRKILCGILALFCVACGAETVQSPYQDGKHYQRLPSEQPDGGDKVEVMEFFWYGCSHCADFEPYMQSWKASKPANVKVTLVPAIFRPDWRAAAQAYYALEALGQADKIHPMIFDQIHKLRKPHSTPEHYADMVAELGVNRKEFVDAMNSFVVDSRIRQAEKLLRDYRVAGVPTVAVNGKYTTGGGMAGSYAELLKVMNHLVALESKPAK